MNSKNSTDYDLRAYIPQFISPEDTELRKKLLHDYRETVHRLYMDNFCLAWKNWSHENDYESEISGPRLARKSGGTCTAWPIYLKRRDSGGSAYKLLKVNFPQAPLISMTGSCARRKLLPGLMSISTFPLT